jgi:F0F1-type ATP synthase assembly protein I
MSDPRDPLRQTGEGPKGGDFAAIGLQFAVSIILFLFIGQFLDRELGTGPWLVIVSVFVGAGLSFYNMYRKLSAIQARDDAARASRNDKSAS